MRGQSWLDDVAGDLAMWIDNTADEVARAFAPARAPFSAQITEEQKLGFYKDRIFNPDGSPNQAGRQAEIQRLGAEGFGHVYQQVLARYPELRPPPQAEIEVPEQWPPAGPAPAGPPGPPPGPLMMPPGPPPGPPVALPMGG